MDEQMKEHIRLLNETKRAYERSGQDLDSWLLERFNKEGD